MPMPIGPVKVSATKDAEVRLSKAGNEYVTLTVAYNERVKGADGTWGPLMWEDAKNNYDSVAEFLDARVFAGDDTTVIETAKGLKKGDFIEITGRRSLRGFIRKDGTRGTAADVIIDTITVVNRKDGGEKQVVESNTTPF